MKTSICLTLATTLFILNSCKVDPEYSLPIDTFFEKHRKPSQFYTLNSGDDDTISTKRKTEIIVPSNAFILPSGEPVTGEIQLEVKEIYKKSDMVLSRIHTTYGNLLLESAGMVYVNATQNGTPLSLDSEDNKRLTIVIPAAQQVDPNMLPFIWAIRSRESFVNPVNSFPSSGDGTWGTTENTNINFDTIPPSKYVLQLSNLAFINCDRFYNSSAPIESINIMPNIEFEPQNIVVYIVLAEINSIINCSYDYSLNPLTFTSIKIPTSMTATIIGFAVSEDEQFFAKKEITISQNMNETLNFYIATDEEITQEMEKLND